MVAKGACPDRQGFQLAIDLKFLEAVAIPGDFSYEDVPKKMRRGNGFNIRPPNQYAAQSIAFLPLTSGSTVSDTSNITQQPYFRHDSPISGLKSDYETKPASTGFSRNWCESFPSKSGSASYLLKQEDLPCSLDIKDTQHKFMD
jgi:hypothetical protein